MAQDYSGQLDKLNKAITTPKLSLQNLGGGVVTKIGANFDWQFQLPMKGGVLATANFVGSWHWQLGIGS